MKTAEIKVGEVRFEIEWCSRFFIDENGEHDFDRDEMTYRDFSTIEAARKAAAKIVPDGYGLVQIRKKVAVSNVPGYPRLIDWEYSDVLEEVDVPFTEPRAAQ